MDSLLFALWFFLPAGIANVTPVFASKIPTLKDWDTPVDLGLTFRSKPILGPHKTIRGILLGTLLGTLVFLFQVQAYENFAWAREVSNGLDYSQLSVWLGILLSFGALSGDIVKSFFKRQFKVSSGKSWFPFDQIDYILGGLILSTIIVILGLNQYILILVVWFLIHLLSSYIGYLLKLKKDPI